MPDKKVQNPDQGGSKADKRLTDLDPRWVGAGGEGISDKDGNPVPKRTGVGISFDCPCGGVCGARPFLHFENPTDGDGPFATTGPMWKRTGEDFATLTLRPSILRRDGCAWHGYLTDGVLRSV